MTAHLLSIRADHQLIINAAGLALSFTDAFQIVPSVYLFVDAASVEVSSVRMRAVRDRSAQALVFVPDNLTGRRVKCDQVVLLVHCKYVFAVR